MGSLKGDIWTLNAETGSVVYFPMATLVTLSPELARSIIDSKANSDSSGPSSQADSTSTTPRSSAPSTPGSMHSGSTELRPE